MSHGLGNYIIGYNASEMLEQITAEEVSSRKRVLKYRFYPHFHPYASELLRRLIEIKGSIQNLQDADTDYLKDKGRNTAWKTLPNSFRAMLSDYSKVSLPDNAKIVLNPNNLNPNNPISLSDGRRITFSDAFHVTFPGSVVATSIGGTQVTLKDNVIAHQDSTQINLIRDTPIIIPDGTPATLAGSTEIIRSDGAKEYLPNGTQVILLGGKPQPNKNLYDGTFFERYGPNDELVQLPYPVKDLDFTSSGAYSIYNWELFFHVPLTLAIHLSQNQRYQEAQRWFHYVFDPTDDSDGPTPERFWKVRPFQTTDTQLIEEIIINLSTGDDVQLKQDTEDCIKAWMNAPFRPHIIARYRPTAYMFKTVMAYMDNLVAWGDSLFRQDTGESINEATQLYVLAANLLGPRPQAIPKKGSIRPHTYANLREDLNALSDAMVDMENSIPYDNTLYPTYVVDFDRLSVLRSLSSPYFCIPRNDKLIGYWDTVADRLFKIRNSLNIQGIFRQLPLFEPPIDPALLARAAASGLDVGAIISGINQPLPLVRFQFLVMKAAEICQEVKSLGSGLLSAIEKEDNEALAILRAKHERVVLEIAEVVKYEQLQEASKSREALNISLDNYVERYKYYEKLLGKKDDEININDIDDLNKDSMEKMQYIVQFEESGINLRPPEINFGEEGDIAEERKISSYEEKELKDLGTAQALSDAAAATDSLCSFLSLIPQFRAHTEPGGVGTSTEFGGEQLHNLMSALSSGLRLSAGRLTFEANKAAKMGSYERREQEWAFQSNAAAGEINQILKQLRAAQIREAMADREWKNHQQQIIHSREIEKFLAEENNGKWANKDFYTWMKREVRGLYSQCFQFAIDISKKAERALQHELSDPKLSFIQFGYLDGKEGLLAGEKLYLDIKRMEMAYHDLNQREYELNKSVSLLQVNPYALLQLRAIGQCTFSLPEELFDMDGPGHYFRRIKSIAISVPCVVGPYTSINCRLTMLKSSIRKASTAGDGYARQTSEDDRFSDYYGSLQSIVTSTGQNDSGLFEMNLHDERYLPFEGSGVISEWRLELPANPSKGDPCQFDYETISDVILHIRYTAREGGAILKAGSLSNLKEKIEKAEAEGSVRLFSVRHEFPTDWAKFKSIKIGGEIQSAKLSLELKEDHYPFWSKGRLESIKKAYLYARPISNKAEKISVIQTQLDGELEDNSEPKEDYFEPNDDLGDLLECELVSIPLPVPVGDFSIKLSTNLLENMWVALAWGRAE